MLNDVLFCPLFCLSSIDTKDEVQVFGHDCVGGDINGEDSGQERETLDDPGFTMFVILACKVILAVQEGAPDTAVNAVVVVGIFERNEFLVRSCHVFRPWK